MYRTRSLSVFKNKFSLGTKSDFSKYFCLLMRIWILIQSRNRIRKNNYGSGRTRNLNSTKKNIFLEVTRLSDEFGDYKQQLPVTLSLLVNPNATIFLQKNWSLSKHILDTESKNYLYQYGTFWSRKLQIHPPVFTPPLNLSFTKAH
jgi:hypothetical protein